MNYHYVCSGLKISSDIKLPELVAIDDRLQVDVTISRGHIDHKGLDEPLVATADFQASPSELWFHISDVARFKVTGATLIEYDPLGSVDEQTLRLFLLGSCLGALLHQRGLLALHGNAIRIGDSCAVFAGVSGSGKSSLAAAFHQAGFEILADDICVIDGAGLVHATYPQLKLWQDTVDHLNINAGELRRIPYQQTKYAYRLSTGFCADPLPLSCIYILSGWPEARVMIEPLHGCRKFAQIREHTYRLHYLEAMGKSRDHLQACSALANNAKVSYVRRPQAGFQVKEIINLVCAND
jgi:hypothetical protein